MAIRSQRISLRTGSTFGHMGHSVLKCVRVVYKYAWQQIVLLPVTLRTTPAGCWKQRVSSHIVHCGCLCQRKPSPVYVSPGVKSSCMHYWRHVTFLSLFTIRSHEGLTVTHKSLLVGDVSDILINTTVGNTGPEAAYNVKLVLTHPSSLTLSRVEGGAQFICETDQITTRTFCSTPNGLKSGAQVRHNVSDLYN